LATRDYGTLRGCWFCLYACRVNLWM